MILPAVLFLLALIVVLPLFIFSLRRQEQKQLTDAKNRLEQMHNDFTAKLVHELRAPLTVIRGAADMFLGDPTLIEKVEGKEILTTIKHSSEDMLTMVNDLLDVYKIEAGKFQVLKTRGSLSETIHDRVVFFNRLALAKGVSITAEIADHDLLGDFDRERISQVLNNLLSNAIKFTPAPGRIVVSARLIQSSKDINWRFGPPDQWKLAGGSAYLVAISDTGEGIPSNKIPELFSKFKQLHPSDGQGGSGLGLAIAKGIVESHGGQIFLESKPAEGTTVYFTLPAAGT